MRRISHIRPVLVLLLTETPMASSCIQTDRTHSPTDELLYDPMKPSTFVAPTLGTPYGVIIEFCDRVSTLASHSADSHT